MSTEAFDPDQGRRSTEKPVTEGGAMWMRWLEVPGCPLQIDLEERASVQRYLAHATRSRLSLIRRWWAGCL